MVLLKVQKATMKNIRTFIFTDRQFPLESEGIFPKNSSFSKIKDKIY